MARIYPSKLEQQTMIAEFHIHYTRGLSKADAFKKATEKLDANRRPLRYNTAFFKNYQKALAKNEIAPPAPLEEYKAPPEIVFVEKIVVQKEYPDYGKIPTVTLCRTLMERLANLEETCAILTEAKSKLDQKRRMEDQYDRQLDPRPREQQPADEPLRLLVVGLLDSQVADVQTRIASITRPLKIRWYDSQHSQIEIGAAQHVIVTKFSNHSWWEKAKSQIDKENVHFIDGGIQAVAQKIWDLSSRTPTRTNGNVHNIPKALTPT